MSTTNYVVSPTPPPTDWRHFWEIRDPPLETLRKVGLRHRSINGVTRAILVERIFLQLFRLILHTLVLTKVVAST